jgi:hypothetical protein
MRRAAVDAAEQARRVSQFEGRTPDEVEQESALAGRCIFHNCGAHGLYGIESWRCHHMPRLLAGQASWCHPVSVQEEGATYTPIRRRTFLITLGLAVVFWAGAALWTWVAVQGVKESDLAVRQAQLQADAIRNVLGFGAALGGLVALFLAIRRQYVNERTARVTEHDATERRITELYVRASEQLGSEKAPVRMAGLYALERLGQGNLSQRQTIVNLICSYLRMPYLLPDDPYPYYADPDSQDDSQEGEPEPPTELVQARRQELESRLTAQRILAEHLGCPMVLDDDPPANFWSGMDVDLSGATLVNFDLTETRIKHLSLRGGRLCIHGQRPTAGAAGFVYMRVDGRAVFDLADFQCQATFMYARFTGRTYFRHCRFGHGVDFGGAKFEASADFSRFSGRPTFNGAMATRSPDDPHRFPRGWYVSDSMGEGDMGLLLHHGAQPDPTEKDQVSDAES